MKTPEQDTAEAEKVDSFLASEKAHPNLIVDVKEMSITLQDLENQIHGTVDRFFERPLSLRTGTKVRSFKR